MSSEMKNSGFKCGSIYFLRNYRNHWLGGTASAVIKKHLTDCSRCRMLFSELVKEKRLLKSQVPVFQVSPATINYLAEIENSHIEAEFTSPKRGTEIDLAIEGTSSFIRFLSQQIFRDPFVVIMVFLIIAGIYLTKIF